jgi:hypothetical protein
MSNWISVKDKKPNFHVHVIFRLVKGTYIAVLTVDNIFLYSSSNIHNARISIEEAIELNAKWQPLPEPPKD